MVDETSAKEAAQVAFTAAQVEHADLEQTAVVVCQEFEGKGASSGSSMPSCLRSLGRRVAERIWSAFHLGIQRTLRVVSTHYDMDLEQVSSRYIIAPFIEGDAARDAMEEADTAVEGFATVLSRKIDDNLLPNVEDNAAEGPQGGGNL